MLVSPLICSPHLGDDLTLTHHQGVEGAGHVKDVAHCVLPFIGTCVLGDTGHFFCLDAREIVPEEPGYKSRIHGVGSPEKELNTIARAEVKELPDIENGEGG